MASEQELWYHRSFLSPFYMDNFRPPPIPKNKVEEIRLRDPNEFEEVRQDLARALKVPYRPGQILSYSHDFSTTKVEKVRMKRHK